MSGERFKFLQCTFYQQTLVCTNFPGTPIAKETLPQRPSLDKIAARTDLAGHVTKFMKESFPGWVLYAVTPLEASGEIINLWIMKECVMVAVKEDVKKAEDDLVVDGGSDTEEDMAQSGYVVVYDK